MTNDPPPPPTRSDDAGPPITPRGCLKPLKGLAFVALGGLLLSVGLLVGYCSADSPVAPLSSTTVIQRGPTVLVAVRDLARLEGTSFHLERVVDLKEKQNRFAGLVQAEDAILLVAAGDVTAGVDLSKLEQGDIRVEQGQALVEITLPRATVFSARLDNERTYVHTRNTDLLAERKETLETRARQEAERTLRASALEAGLLERAERNVALTIEALVRSLGYREVSVTFRQSRSVTE